MKKINLFILLLCLTVVLNFNDNTVATIAIGSKYENDEESFRYVIWNGEKYSPHAFMAVSKNQKGIKTIRLMKTDHLFLDCAKAMAKYSDFKLILDESNKLVDVNDAGNVKRSCYVETANTETVGDLLKRLGNEQNAVKLSDQFIKNSGFIYSAIKNVHHLKERCEKHFPEYTDQNNDAYMQWSSKHLDFHDEINAIFKQIIEYLAKSEGLSVLEMQIKIEKEISLSLEVFADQLIEQSGQNYKNWCKNYPNYVKSEIADVEKYFAQRVKGLRGH